MPEASGEPAAGGDAAAPAPSEEPETELPNGGDLDSGATATESPESGGEASEPAPDEAKSAPPAWGKPEAGTTPRSSRRSPVATAVLAAVRSRIASHFPAVLPEQALSRHPFANLAPLGDSSPGDTPPGDTSLGEAAPGEVEPGDVEPGDVEPGDLAPGEAAPGDVEPGDVESGEAPPQGGTVATSEPPLPVPVIGETAPAEAVADLEPAAGLPNGGDLDGSATAPESPETGSQASEPAPDETKSAPPAWGKPEAGASPRSSRRSPVATAVLAAVRSRLASHFPAVLPEQALNRHPFANLASIGDTPPGDTSSGDVEPGAVEPGETIPQGGTAATSEPSLATPVIGETAPTEAAADLEPATGEGSAPQTDKTTPSAHPPEADTGQAKTSEVDTQAVPRIVDQATPESAEQPRRTASVDDPKPSTVTSKVTTINYLKQNVLPITRKYSADGDTSADTAEVATVEASSDGLSGGMLLGDAGLIGGLLPTPSPDGSGPGVATGTPEGNSRNGASNQDFDNFSNVRVAAKLDAGIGEQAFRIHLRTTSALADGSREVSNLYDKVPVVPVRKFSTAHPQPVDKNAYSNLSPGLAESTEVGERVSPVAAVRGSRGQAGARREGLGRSAAAVRAGKIPIAAESATVRARAASGTPVNRSPLSPPGLQEPLTVPESGTSAVHSAAGVSPGGAKTPTWPEAGPTAKQREGTLPPVPGTGQPAVEAASFERNLGVSRLNVMLNDERMGRVVVRLSERAGLVEAMVRSDNSRTRQLLAGELPALFDSLSRHGLRADETAMGHESAERGRHFDPREGRSRHQGQQRRSRRGQPGQQQGVFRVRMES